MYGDAVIYTGPGSENLLPGTQGRALSRTAVYAHVMWSEGALTNQVTLVSTEDLAFTVAVRTVASSLDDSLEFGSLSSLASAEDAYNESGGDGLVSHLASGGFLAAYTEVAEDAYQMVSEALRRDAVLRHVTASMAPEEADDVYRRAARALLTDGD